MKRKSVYISSILSMLLISILLSTTASAGFLSEIEEMLKPEIAVSGDYSYRVYDDTATLVAYTGSEEDLEVPSEIDGYPVTSIEEGAFYHMTFRSVRIPESVQSISDQAFEYAVISEELSLPENISILTDAFSYTTLPEVVTIPENAYLGQESFAYCRGVVLLCVEPHAVISERAVDYSKSLLLLICADGVKLEDHAFEYGYTLKQVILCGDVEMNGEPFAYCDDAVLSKADAEVFLVIMEEFMESLKAPAVEGNDSATDYQVETMTFSVPWEMQRTSLPGYDLGLIDANGQIMVGAAEFPPSVLDFEKEETVQTMAASAENYVNVDDAYQTEVCGYPAVWIDFHNDIDHSIGTYLYISTEKNMYHLMFLTVLDNREDFLGIVETVVIDDQPEEGE